MKNGQFPAVLQLSSLNGKNGFKIDGEINNDWSGYSVSAAGDINGDKYGDLLIGAPFALGGNATGKGRSYVVFGGPEVGSGGVIALSGLNGKNGFKLDGEAVNDESGHAVSSAGDVNGDGYDDLLIGAPFALGTGYPEDGAGRSYVIFGSPNIGSSGELALSSLNGANGFKLDGQLVNDYSGYSLNTAGDINRDGYSDVLIGAPDAGGSFNLTGWSYVVFGSRNVGKSGDIALANLNGLNGFKLNGESTSDDCGHSVSTAGDVNGDKYDDFLIGAIGHNNYTGRTYVVFGGPLVGSSGTVALSNLNGKNGFKLDGETSGSWSGFWVSAAGDVNGDGYADLLIKASNYNNYAGRSYLIFGGSNIGSSGIIALSNLNGDNGFKLEKSGQAALSGAGDINGDGYADFLIGNSGNSYMVFGNPVLGKQGMIILSNLNGTDGFEINSGINSCSGYSVSAAGDVNGDGVADWLNGDFCYNNYTGRSYVIFGDIPPVLINNTLSLYNGEKILLNSGNLAATDRNHDNNSLVFVPANISHGQFEAIDNPGVALVNFQQSQITQKSIQFVHDGSSNPPSYNMSVYTSGIAWVGPVAAVVNMNYLKIINNQLIINQGQSVILTPQNLSASDTQGDNENLDFLISGIQQGHFEFTIFSGQPIIEFKQKNITDQIVCFVHDNSINAPIYQVSVSNNQIITAAQMATIDFDVKPILGNNQLVINQGQTVTLTATDLNATHPGSAESNLNFLISDLQHGNFAFNNAPNKSILVFQQQNITDGLVSFVHDNSPNAPGYRVSITDGRVGSDAQAADIDFDAKPVLDNNQLTINQGQVVTLTVNDLNATHPGGSENALNFLISNIVHGYFQFNSVPGKPIQIFQQQNITENRVSFVHDNSPDAPGYVVSVSDGRVSSDPQSASIDFDAKPVLDNNQLTINQGQVVTLTANDLNATHSGGSENALNFLISNIVHGYFQFNSVPGKPIQIFQQQNITENRVSFVHDNSPDAPGYVVSVSDDRISSDPQAASIDFDAKPVLGSNQLTVNQGQVVTLTANNLNATHPGGSESDLSFLISDIVQGYFQFNSAPGKPIQIFQQQNITESRVSFVHDNSPDAPGYVVSVTDGRVSSDPQPATIDFDTLPSLLNNQLTINQGQTVMLSSNNLSASQGGSTIGDLSFLISNGQHGYFQLKTAPGQPVLVFQQQNITDQLVSFVHDNTPTAPAYLVSVSDGRAVTVPQAPSIDFDAKPLLTSNQLTINQGQTVTLTSKNLQASHAGGSAGDLTFQISSGQHGYFQFTSASSQAIVSFQQQNVSDSRVQFVHDNGQSPPSYLVSVTDGRVSSDPQSASIDFDAQPVLENNQLTINQGEVVTLGAVNLYASHATGSEGELNFVISNCQHGHFELTTRPGQAVTIFQQQNITDSRVNFVHDNSPTAPTYRVAATDGRLSSSAQTADINFDTLPILINNELRINQGQTVVFTSDNLKASHEGDAEADLSFSIQNCQHGHFEWTNAPSSLITLFQQQNITDHRVSFAHDNSQSPPAYRVSVTDGRATSNLQPAMIYFNGMPDTDSSDSGLSVVSMVGIALAGGVIALMGLAYGYYKYSRRRLETFTEKLLPINFNYGETKVSGEIPYTDKITPSISTLEIAYDDLEFKEKLSDGHVGSVYQGVYKFNPVAIKKINAISLEAKALIELKKEAQIMASIQSDFIVQIRGLCSKAPNYCIVMELMPKGSLDQLLKASPDLPLVVLLQIGLDVIYGLCHLHDKNILHRDLKSLNVLLSNGLRAKISDFGLSKVKSELTSASSTQSLQGTFGWMAPELFEEKPVLTKAADIYAYGMILWELMIKPYRAPFQGLASASVLGAKLKRGEKQEEIPGKTPPPLKTLILSCWREPAKRPTAQQIATSLGGIFQSTQSSSSASVKSWTPGYTGNLTSRV